MRYRATCVEIRPSDGAQRYELHDAPANLHTIWQMGINRTPGVQVGDEGYMTFIGSRTWGGYVFDSDKELSQ